MLLFTWVHFLRRLAPTTVKGYYWKQTQRSDSQEPKPFHFAVTTGTRVGAVSCIDFQEAKPFHFAVTTGTRTPHAHLQVQSGKTEHSRKGYS
eukprot:jgi/Tetstr1/448237/TSEL_035525.t1